jgi:nitroreductase
MEAIECIKTRMSIRKFKSEPVPKELLLDIVRTAQRSPSYKNGQPWELAIVSGAKKEALSERLVELINAGTPTAPDIPEPAAWSQVVEARMSVHMDKRAKIFGVDFSDPELIKKSKIANSRFYGAPHGIFLYQDGELPTWSIFDMGLFAQSLMLAAHAKGLGTVPQAFLIDHSSAIKEFLGLPTSKRLILGMSIGYPDIEGGARDYESDRVDLDEICKWFE